MAINVAQILNPTIFLKPSIKLRKYITTVKVTDDMPLGIKNLVFKNKVKQDVQKLTKLEYLITDQDIKFINSLNLNSDVDFFTKVPLECKSSTNEKTLSLQDLHWLCKYIQRQNEDNDVKVYLHELIEGSEVILPKNQEVPRNAELDKRCRRLKAEQENRDYNKMTKNVDNSRRRLPEDTISFQLREMNRHLLAIFQFIVSVVAGFAFGFIGVELIIGSLDFGFRLLLGIICALIIALAELYFLAKRLNEDLQFEYAAEKQNKHVKID